jgi:hypothetical protein
MSNPTGDALAAAGGTLMWQAWNGRWHISKWPAVPRDSCEAPKPDKKDVLCKEHELSAEEFALPLGELIRRYPPPETAVPVRNKLPGTALVPVGESPAAESKQA